MIDSSFYGDDLADLHNQQYEHVARNACHEISKIIAQFNFRKGLIVELGCGSGLISQFLFDHGFTIEAIDISYAFIQLAKQRVPKGQFYVQSYKTYQVPTCQMVISIGEVFTYKGNSKYHWREVKETLQQVYNALVPGGVLLFDVLTTDLEDDGVSTRLVEYEQWDIVLKKARKGNELIRDITVFRRLPNKLYRKTQEVHSIFLFDKPLLMSTLRSIGFEIDELRKYGRYQLRSGHIGFVCRKASTS